MRYKAHEIKCHKIFLFNDFFIGFHGGATGVLCHHEGELKHRQAPPWRRLCCCACVEFAAGPFSKDLKTVLNLAQTVISP